MSLLGADRSRASRLVRRQHHARRADAALRAAALEERVLDGVQHVSGATPSIVVPDRAPSACAQRHQAAVDQLAVEQHRAGAALAFAAAFLGAGQPQLSRSTSSRRAIGWPSSGVRRAVDGAARCYTSPASRPPGSSISLGRQRQPVDATPVASAIGVDDRRRRAVHRQLADALGAARGRSAYGHSSKKTRMCGRSIDVGMM